VIGAGHTWRGAGLELPYALVFASRHVRTYTLGEFFDVWGVRLTRSCLGGYCAGGDRRLRVYVDGAAYRGDPTTLTLQPHQEIVVAFGTAAQLPSPIPSSYRFPPGL
jgi:hypothetical protein